MHHYLTYLYWYNSYISLVCIHVCVTYIACCLIYDLYYDVLFD